MSSGISKPNYKTLMATPPGRGEGFVDLTPYMNALSNYADIAELLSDEDEARIVDFVRAAGKMSHQSISKRYDAWEEADRAHDCWVPPDATEFRNKVVIADTRAIADTVVTYLMAATTGRNPMFQLEGTDRKSRKPALILERLLHQHMRRTAGEAKLAQLHLDSVRYGFAPTKVVWDARSKTNQITNFDPRRTFPDPRVSWGDMVSGQFLIFTSFSSYSALLQTGLYPKLGKYPGLKQFAAGERAAWEINRWIKTAPNGLSINPRDPINQESFYFSLDRAHTVNEMWVRLTGWEIGVPSIEEIWLLIVVLDEHCVIRCQLNPYGRQFPSVSGSIFNDAHKTFGQSLYDVLMPLHHVATWLLRSRVDNVQAALNNLVFADPTQVAISDLINRNPWNVVRMLPGAKVGEGVHIAQIPDVTRGHWQDIAALSELKQRVAAAGDAQQGMPTGDGIRSATEIARLSQLGSQRLGMLSRVISSLTLRPMVKMMVSNLQDVVSYEGSMKVSRDNLPGLLSDMVKDDYLDFTVADFQGHIDYLIVDGTLPAEPSRSPETWLNVLQVINQAGLGMEYDMGQMVEETIRSMGISDMDRFRISREKQEQGMTPSQQLMLMEKMRGASVMPQGDMERQIQAGNLIPFRGMPAQQMAARRK